MTTTAPARGRRSRRAPALTGVMILAALLAGCGGARPQSAGGGDADVELEATSAAPSPPTELTVHARGWLAGSEIAVTSAELTDDTVVLSAQVRNTANTEAFAGHELEAVLLELGSGAPLPASAVSSPVPAGATTTVRITFPMRGDDPVDLATGVLVLGGPGYRTWRVPLGGGESTGAEPYEASTSGVADAEGLTFTATTVQVLPWACDKVDDYGPGGSGRIWFAPGADDEVALVVWGDIRETVSIHGGDTPLAASVTGPDGMTAAQIGTVNTVFDVNQGIDDYPLCFSVPAPADGDYTMTWNSYRQASAQLTVHVEGPVG
jgi:hypothetical protein